MKSIFMFVKTLEKYKSKNGQILNIYINIYINVKKSEQKVKIYLANEIFPNSLNILDIVFDQSSQVHSPS